MVVGSLLLVPMHFVEPYFVLTGMAPLYWMTAAVVMGAAYARAPKRVGDRRRASSPEPAPEPASAPALSV
jgi:hypothetical protein